MNYDIDSADFFVRIGYECLVNVDYVNAELWFNKAIEAGCSQNVEVYAYLSFLAEKRLDYVNAWMYVEKAYQELKLAENKGNAEFQQILLGNRGDYARRIGLMDEALKSYLEKLETVENLEEKYSVLDNYLYTLICMFDEPEIIVKGHHVYNQLFVNERKNISDIKFTKKKKNDKIIIGYMSPDFRQHVMFSFYYALLWGYNKDEFYVICYQLNHISDGFTQHLKPMVDEWRDVSQLSSKSLAEVIKNDKVDILVDLAGHSAYSGLPVFVYRPAPVQISGLGWMETTGLEETDYFITDIFADPIDANYLLETPIYLESQFCYTARNDIANPQEAPCIHNRYVTFGVFNNYCKYNDNILVLWKQILDKVPNSRLLLKSQVYISDTACVFIRKRLEKLGFDNERVDLEPATNTYMNRYLSVDIALDTYPYNGGGTTCDALYMGVPVVSLYGDRRGTRFGYSILSNVGLGMLATDKSEEYVEIAVNLAKDYELLNDLHKYIRSMMIDSPVMDSRSYVKKMEAYYSAMLNAYWSKGDV